MPSNLFKVTVIQYWVFDCWLDPEGRPCDRDTPGACFVKRRKVRKGTPGAEKVKKKSSKWYGRLPGSPKPVPLSCNKVAAQQMLAALVNKSELAKVGISDRFEEHRKRPLAEHLDDWQRVLRAGTRTEEHVNQLVAAVRRVLADCRFLLADDVSASRVQEFLADLRKRGKEVETPDPLKDCFTKRELARILKVSPSAIPPLVRRHGLEATGKGKARRFPRATVEALVVLRSRGVSVRTANFYLVAFKHFLNWMVKDRRLAENPVAHLSIGNVNLDRRHDRRELSLEELHRLLQGTRESPKCFRGLNGLDRFHLYATACGTGFRASALASLTAEDFDLTGGPPTVTLAAQHAKNRKTKVQPLPPDLADLLRDYLKAARTGQPIWGGTWASAGRGAEMLRIDLEAAGIPYVIDGPDGPLYADFHALRHSYLTLGGRAGIDLRTLQELAGHSTPILTARYSHRRLSDLAGAVEKLPRLLPSDLPTGDRCATGTDPVCTGFAQADDSRQDYLRLDESVVTVPGEECPDHNPLIPQGVEAGRDSLILVEGRVGDRTRTGDILIHSQVL